MSPGKLLKYGEEGNSEARKESKKKATIEGKSLEGGGGTPGTF